jgi:hypothetical protein
MKTHCIRHLMVTGAALAVVLLTGCATQNTVPHHQYLQRSPIRVAIVPGLNRTDQPEAVVVLDKAWQAGLTKLGYVVVSADQVVTYAASVGASLQAVRNRSVADLGKDLRVDAILHTEILKWATSYKVVVADSTVAGSGRLVECATGATIWERHWVLQRNSGTSSDPLAMLISAAVTALVQSATDAPTQMAQEAVSMSAVTVPLPGFAPPPKTPPKPMPR